MKKNTKIISQILFVLISYVCNAQVPAPDDIPPPPGLPIDGAVIILKVLAVILGTIYIYRSYIKPVSKEVKS